MQTSRMRCLVLALCIPLLLSGQALPPGPQVLTFFSDADDTEQPYGVYIPKNYDVSQKYPLVIMLHGAGSNHRLALRRVFGKSNADGENDVEATRYFPEWKDIDYIVASPFARGTAGYQGIPEKDVYDVLADVKKRFNIDEDRVYLTGLSMGGGGTLWIGLTRPDIWAALAPVCPAPPRGTEHYLPNSINLPMHFFHGDADKAVPVTVSRDWVEKLKNNGTRVFYSEYPGVEHNSWENAYADEAIFEWFAKWKRDLFPDQVKFSTTQLKYNKAYWIRLDDITPGIVSAIDARFAGRNQITVQSRSLRAFTLKLRGHTQFVPNTPLQITLDGKKHKVTVADSVSFILQEGKWLVSRYQPNANEKKPGLEGPIGESFTKRHIYVYGTRGNPTAQEVKARMEAAAHAANWSAYRNAFLGRIMFFPRIVADRDVRQSDMESCDLILFGTRETNSIIEKLADQLPMHLSTADNETGLMYTFPINGHYVTVNSGLPWWITNQVIPYGPPLAFQLVGNFKDFVLYKGSSDNILVEGYFNNTWVLSPEHKKLLEENGVITGRDK